MTVLSIAGALSLFLSLITAHDGSEQASSPPASLCRTISSKVSNPHEAESATSFCSRFLSMGTKVSDVEDTATTAATTTDTVTVTRTKIPTHTTTAVVTSTSFSGATTTVKTVTTVTSVLDSYFACFSFASTPATEKRAITDEILSPPFASGLSSKSLSLACECLGIPSSTTLAALLKTTATTKPLTITTTAKAPAKTTSTVTVTSTTYITVPTATLVHTKTLTYTSSLSTDATFRISIPPSTPTPEAQWLINLGPDTFLPASFWYFHTGLSTDPRGELILNSECYLQSPHSGGFATLATEEAASDKPTLVFSGKIGESGGDPIACRIDVATNEMVCTDPFGGDTTYVCPETFSGTYTADLWYLGPDSNGCGFTTKMYATFTGLDH